MLFIVAFHPDDDDDDDEDEERREMKILEERALASLITCMLIKRF